MVKEGPFPVLTIILNFKIFFAALFAALSKEWGWSSSAGIVGVSVSYALNVSFKRKKKFFLKIKLIKVLILIFIKFLPKNEKNIFLLLRTEIDHKETVLIKKREELRKPRSSSPKSSSSLLSAPPLLPPAARMLSSSGVSAYQKARRANVKRRGL